MEKYHNDHGKYEQLSKINDFKIADFKKSCLANLKLNDYQTSVMLHQHQDILISRVHI